MTAPPYINHGRWVVTCPRCNDGLLVDIQVWRARCRTCRVEYATPAPAGWQEAENILAKRPLQHRNWFPTIEAAAYGGGDRADTLDDLRQENEEH